MAPKDSLLGTGAFSTDGENRAHSTICSIMRSWVWPAGGSFYYRSPSFIDKDSSLSIFSFSAMVYACFPSLSVNASTVAPA